MSSSVLQERTIGGLHDFLVEKVFSHLARPGERAVDLGAGSGALAVRLEEMGWEVLAADKDAAGFKASVPFRQVDLNDPRFSAQLGEGQFSMVTSIEVIEHVEAPVGLLRNARRLLKPGGVAVFTTPNVDCVPARVKFLLFEKVRMMDAGSDATHISPIFWDLLTRQFLPLAGLQLREHLLYPPNGFIVTRPRYAWAMRVLARFLGGDCKFGDNHVLVLEPRREKS